MKCQIAFMPYVGKHDSYVTGGYEIWPYREACEQKIGNVKVRDKIDSILRIYHERKIQNREAVDIIIPDIMVITPIDYNDKEYQLLDEDISNIRAIVHMLSFVYSFNYPVADDFKLEIYSFNTNNDRIQLFATAFTRIEFIKILKPYQTTRIYYLPYEGAFEYLSKILEKKEEKGIIQIIRALENLYHAAATGDMLTHESRILHLVMCFETLIDFQNGLELARKVNKAFLCDRAIIEIRELKQNGEVFEEELALVAWWVFDLYRLRNDIIHCNSINWEIDKYGGIVDRLFIGRLIIKAIIADIMYEYIIFPDEFNYYIFRDFDHDQKIDEIRKM